MADELETTVRNAAMKLAKALEDATQLEVETQYVVVGDQGSVDFTQARPLARTIILLDGDTKVILPLKEDQSGVLELEQTLLDQHQLNVTTAIEYRARLLEALLSMVSQIRTR